MVVIAVCTFNVCIAISSVLCFTVYDTLDQAATFKAVDQITVSGSSFFFFFLRNTVSGFYLDILASISIKN